MSLKFSIRLQAADVTPLRSCQTKASMDNYTALHFMKLHHSLKYNTIHYHIPINDLFDFSPKIKPEKSEVFFRTLPWYPMDASQRREHTA